MINKSSILPEAIVLCGGKGERLRPVTNDIPKPLVKINNKPILHYVVEHLKQYGIENIHIASGYKSKAITNYFSENSYNVSIKIHNSGEVDIIKRIQDIFLKVHNDVLVLYGDTFSDVDINDLIYHHRKSAKDVTMAVWPLKISYGLVGIAENGTVESFFEKPTLDKWVNIGYFYINRGFRDFVLSHNSFESFLIDTVGLGSINAFKHHGLHITVNTLSDLEEAQYNIKKIIEIKK